MYILKVRTTAERSEFRPAADVSEAFSVGRRAIASGEEVLEVLVNQKDEHPVSPRDIMTSWMNRQRYAELGVVYRD
jgi:hypothetical protein